MLLSRAILALSTLLRLVLAQENTLPECWQAALERIRVQINTGYCSGTELECICQAHLNYGVQSFASKSCIEQGQLIQAVGYLSDICIDYYREKAWVVTASKVRISIMLPTIATTPEFTQSTPSPTRTVVVLKPTTSSQSSSRAGGMEMHEQIRISFGVIFGVIIFAFVVANIWYRCGPGKERMDKRRAARTQQQLQQQQQQQQQQPAPTRPGV